MLPYLETARFLVGDFFSPVFASEIAGERVVWDGEKDMKSGFIKERFQSRLLRR